MKDQIDISIIAPACRPENWINLYKSVVTNLSIEFVFVGPNIPKFELPSNFNFIHSKVKPAQCCEIAARNAKGKFVIIFADDLWFETKFALDKLVEIWNSHKNEFLIVSCLYSNNGIVQPENIQKYNVNNLDSPPVPLAGLMLRKSWEALGGIDSRFIGVLYDLDLALRFTLSNGKVIFSDAVVVEKRELRGNSRLFQENWKNDRKYLDLCWGQNGEGVTKFFKRFYPITPFVESNILVKSQGPRGHWRGEGLIFLEFIQNLPSKFRRQILLNLENQNKFSILLFKLYRYFKTFLA